MKTLPVGNMIVLNLMPMSEFLVTRNLWQFSALPSVTYALGSQE